MCERVWGIYLGGKCVSGVRVHLSSGGDESMSWAVECLGKDKGKACVKVGCIWVGWVCVNADVSRW